jgi:hypothetical protein
MIFLSYSWSNDEIADVIDSFFSQNGVTITRDRRDLKYKQSIKEFMNSIRHAEYVIMIISREYLQSKNCMYEVMEFVKNSDFKDKIIPIIASNAKIFDVHNKIEFYKYWTEKAAELEKSVSNLDPSKSIPIIEELREYKHIENEILDFLKVVTDMNNIVLADNVFNDIHFDTISSFINLSDLALNDVVLNLKLVENGNIKTSDIIEFLSKNFMDFQVYNLKNEFATFKFKTFKNIIEIESELQTKFNKNSFEHLYCFDYKEAYYIAGKKKTDEYNSKSIIWWSHFQSGYTENLKSAGLYSIKEIEKIIKFRDNSYKKEQLGIKANHVNSLDLRVIPIDSTYSEVLISDPNQTYGIADWQDFDGFS